MSRPDEKTRDALSAFVLVDWKYDGPGKVLRWTNKHGNGMKDPAYQVWVMNPDMTEFARWGQNRIYEDPGFREWLKEQSAAWLDSAGPPKKIAFRPAVAKQVRGKLQAKAIDEAREGKRPLLVYFNLPAKTAGLAARGRETELKACREFEKKVLKTEEVLKLSLKFECFDFDLAKSTQRKYAKALGIETMPVIVLYPPDPDADPVILKSPDLKSLLEQLKKLASD